MLCTQNTVCRSNFNFGPFLRVMTSCTWAMWSTGRLQKLHHQGEFKVTMNKLWTRNCSKVKYTVKKAELGDWGTRLNTFAHHLVITTSTCWQQWMQARAPQWTWWVQTGREARNSRWEWRLRVRGSPGALAALLPSHHHAYECIPCTSQRAKETEDTTVMIK